MPVFGKSLFETVLDGLERQDEDEDEIVSSSVRGFNGGFVGNELSGRADTGSDPSLLFENYPLDPVPEVKSVPAWLDRLSIADIAADLGLADCHGEIALRDKRRLFAFENHPDRVSVEYRDQANRRMMIANQLIDAALAGLR